MVKKCVVNHARGSWYPEGQVRLKESFVEKGYDGEFLFSTNESDIGCPTHQDVPYAFKAYLLKQAMEMGLEYVFWCDSAVYLMGPLEKLYEALEKDGYILVLNGWNTGTWCSDAALKTLEITREEAFNMPHIMANMMGFDLRREECREFVRQYYEKANDGVTFKGSWHNRNGEVSSDKRVLGHRHDQTAASVIAWKLGMRNWKKDWTVYSPFAEYPPCMFRTHPPGKERKT